MIRYLIKNYLKLMGRSPVNILLFIAAPLILIAILSSAFSSLMESYERAESFSVGYVMEEGSDFEAYIDQIKDIGEDNEVYFKEYEGGDPKKLMETDGLLSFVEFQKDDYVVYKRNGSQTEGKITEYILTSFMRNADSYKLAATGAGEVPEIKLKVDHPDFMPAVDSVDYYGKIEVVYFLWCGIICATRIISNEKKYGIKNKLQVSGLSDLKIYAARLTASCIAVGVGTAIAAVLSIILFDVKWGVPLLSIAIVALMIIAALASEYMLYYITNNIVLTITISFATVWVAGFFGGSFEVYMFADHPEIMKLISPLYHGNRALVELASTGKSDYAMTSVMYSVAMIVICSAVALLAARIRRRGRA